MPYCQYTPTDCFFGDFAHWEEAIRPKHLQKDTSGWISRVQKQPRGYFTSYSDPGITLG